MTKTQAEHAAEYMLNHGRSTTAVVDTDDGVHYFVRLGKVNDNPDLARAMLGDVDKNADQ